MMGIDDIAIMIAMQMAAQGAQAAATPDVTTSTLGKQPGMDNVDFSQLLAPAQQSGDSSNLKKLQLQDPFQ